MSAHAARGGAVRADALCRNMSMASRQIVELRPARLRTGRVVFDLQTALEGRARSAAPSSTIDAADAALLDGLRRCHRDGRRHPRTKAARLAQDPTDYADLERALDDATRALGLAGAAILDPVAREAETGMGTDWSIDPVLTAIVLAKSSDQLFVAGKAAVVTAEGLARTVATSEPWLVELALSRATIRRRSHV